MKYGAAKRLGLGSSKCICIATPRHGIMDNKSFSVYYPIHESMSA
jgi:hypothetical protein